MLLENVDVLSASDVGRERRISAGQRCGDKENAEVVSASDVGRECRISVAQRCGEGM